MDQQSVFFEEWMRSLREQYKYVVRKQDKVALPSLTAVLHQIGFTDDELTQLRLEATLRQDDVGADYVADMAILAGQAHPAECSCPQCLPIDESQFDDEGQPLADDAREEADESSGQVFAAAAWEDEDEEAEQPLTYEEGLAADDVDDDEEELAEAEEPSAEDPDQPHQTSLF